MTTQLLFEETLLTEQDVSELTELLAEAMEKNVDQEIVRVIRVD